MSSPDYASLHPGQEPSALDRAILSTDAWLAQHGPQQGKIPREMQLHSH
jgi:hypothetical protein